MPDTFRVANTTFISNVLAESPAGLPANNLCNFDDHEMTVTIGNPNQESGTTIWVADNGIVRFFVKNFDFIKTQYSRECNQH